MKIAIEPNGILTFIYDDSLSDLCSEGRTKIKRVSNVEPNPNGGGWLATMEDGKILGPFRLRSRALEEEVKYLESKLF